MKRSIAVILGAAVCTPPLAVAQEQQDATVGEVLVTAQRRVESVQDVPISVSVFTSQDLEKSNINEAKDYLQFAPNVSFTEDGEVGNRGISISIRGVSDVSLGEVVTANSIGFYLDEFNVGTVANGGINPQLRDVEQIEVLRGPQGTYFGRNALAGALNITTKKPKQTFEAEGTVRASRFNTWGVGGVLNVPLSDKVAARLVADYDETDGLVKNVNPDGRSNSGGESKYARLGLRATPNDALTMDLSLAYSKDQDGFDAEVPSGVLDLDTQAIFGSSFVPIGEGLGFYPQNQRRVNHDADEYNNNSYKLANLRFAYDLGGMEIKSITGAIDSDNSRFFDQDNISVDAIVRQNRYSGKSFSQELRLQSTGERTVQWTVGALYAKDKIRQFNSVRAGSEGSYTDPVTGEVIGLLPPIPAGFRINENRRSFTTTSYAAFGDISWKLAELWTLKTGARYTRDKVANRFYDVVNFEGAPLDGAGSDTFTDFAPRVVLQFEPSADATWYLTASKGYKAGGVDILFVPSETDPGTQVGLNRAFDPEEMYNYEIGFKGRFADGRGRFSAAAFYLDWKDMQVQTNFLRDPNDISSSVQATLNASGAKTKGLEFELSGQLSDHLHAGVTGGYLDGKFEDFPEAVLAGNNQIDMSNAKLPRTPEWTGSAYAEYGFSVGDNLSPFVRGELVYRAKSAGDLEGAAALSRRAILSGGNAGQVLPEFPYVMPSYTVFNLRAGLGGEKFDLQAYVENVFDKEYYNGTGDNFGLAGIRLRPHPRIWGLQAVYRMK